MRFNCPGAAFNSVSGALATPLPAFAFSITDNSVSSALLASACWFGTDNLTAAGCAAVTRKQFTR